MGEDFIEGSGVAAHELVADDGDGGWEFRFCVFGGGLDTWFSY